MLKKITSTLTTDGSGDEDLDIVTGHAFARLTRVKFTQGTIADGATLTISDAQSRPLFILTVDGDVDVDLESRNTTATDGSGGSFDVISRAVAEAPINVVIATGGASKTGTLVCYFEL